VFCGRHLLAAKLRPSNIDASAGAVEEEARIAARIRTRWPRVRILLRADSGLAREGLMGGCERNGVDFLFGLAKNARLTTALSPELDAARRHTSKPPGQRGALRTLPGRRWTAGAGRAASSARPNGPAARPTRASLSPRCPAPSMRLDISMRRSTARAATWK